MKDLIDVEATEEAPEYVSGVFMKGVQGAIETSEKRYMELSLEAAGGPEPAKTDKGMGAAEKRTIKKYSRHPFGVTIVNTYCNALKIVSWSDSDGQDSPFLTWWKREGLNAKLRSVLRDSMTGGTGLMEIYMHPTGPRIRALSPKDAAVFSSDRVNERFGDYAALRYHGHAAGKKHTYKVWDDTNWYIVSSDTKAGDKGWQILESAPHGFPFCPVIAFDDMIGTDNNVSSLIEQLVPMLQYARTAAVSTLEATYWTGKKVMFFKNVDKETPIVVNGAPTTQYELLEEEIQLADDNGVMKLPAAVVEGAEAPDLVQSQETNLYQLVNVMKESKNSLAALSGLPLHIFDPSAVPTTAEGSIQSFAPLEGIIRGRQVSIGERLMAIYELWCHATGTEFDDTTYPVWDAATPMSLGIVSDAFSKLATHIPADIVAADALPKAGFTPQRVRASIEGIEKRQSQLGQLQAAMEGF